MAGIYVHIPFCRKKCDYCDFYSEVSLKHQNAFFQALIKEIQIQKHIFGQYQIDTLYFGGGSPSLLDMANIELILNELHKNFSIHSQAEITLEANPEDITLPKLNEYLRLGFNRLSIGIQSFNNNQLHRLGRIHSAEKAETAIQQAFDAGFINLSIDLIFGIPFQSVKSFEKNLQKAVEYRIPHISAYALTVEENTPLARKIENKEIPKVSEKSYLQHFYKLIDFLPKCGYEHYEISNFALPGLFSKHNSSYWKGIPYLGLGPSAHSFNGNERRWNISSISAWSTAIHENKLWYESELLNDIQKYNEYIMTRIRTHWGCNIKEIEDFFGKSAADYFIRQLNEAIKNEWVIKQDNIVILSTKGKLLSNSVCALLFCVDNAFPG